MISILYLGSDVRNQWPPALPVGPMHMPDPLLVLSLSKNVFKGAFGGRSEKEKEKKADKKEDCRLLLSVQTNV